MSLLAPLAEHDAWAELAAALAPWLPRQRWFGGKARRIADIAVADVVLVDGAGEHDLLDVLADVSYADGSAERYQVLLVAGAAAGAVGTVRGVPLAEATDEPTSLRALVDAVVEGSHRKTARGALVHGDPVGEGPSLSAEPVRRLGAEQSNSSVVLGDQAIMKVFRKLEEGLNPDVELTRGLTEHGFPHVPVQHGALLFSDDAGTSALAVLSEFVGGAREGWSIACEEAARVRAGEQTSAEGLLRARTGELGTVIARMHLALGEAFGRTAAAPGGGREWAAGMRAQAERVLELARANPGLGAEPVIALEQQLITALDATRELLDVGALVRTHGDLHLGQVLLDASRGWLVLDFEGEPARPLAERRLPHSPLRDVAGMLRSFDYAAGHAGAATPALVAWRDGLRDDFLSAYVGTVADTGMLPAADADRNALLVAFELDKAVYELGYELANRPSWVGIPADGIRRLLDAQNDTQGLE